MTVECASPEEHVLPWEEHPLAKIGTIRERAMDERATNNVYYRSCMKAN